MNIQPKTEKNVIGNVPCSRATMSLESLIKDLQDLNKEKTLITKKELEALKTKMKKLENENAKLKVDLVSKEAALVAKEADIAEKEEERLFYDQNFHQNVKELTKMKAENKTLKAAVDSLKASMAEKGKISDPSSSTIGSANQINDIRSDDEDDIPVAGPIIAICESNTKSSTSKPSASKKRSRDEKSQKSTKKPKVVSPVPNCENPWKCFVCNSVRFDTIDELRKHLAEAHPMKSFFCEQCPYAGETKNDFTHHNRKHAVNNSKCRTEKFRCEFCKICFDRLSTLSAHIKRYH